MNTKADTKSSKVYSASAYRIRFFVSAFFFLLTALSLYIHTSQTGALCLGIAAFLFGGSLIWRKAISDIKNFQLTEDVFVVISLFAAFLYTLVYILFPLKEFGGINNLILEAVFLLMIVNESKVPVVKEREKAKVFIKKIDDFLPKSARLVLENNKDKKIFASEIKKGDLILVRAGERLPADGVITKGKTEIDESLITGNTVNAFKAPGHKVYGGTLNKLSDIIIEATATLNSSEFMSIIKAVKASERDKEKFIRPVFVYSKYALPAVLLSAVGIWVFILSLAGFKQVMYHAQILLFLIFFSTPAALLVTRSLSGFFTKMGAKIKGIQLSSINALHVFNKSQVCFIDKTGTITYGELKVNQVFPTEKNKLRTLLKSALSAEYALNSPFAAAIREYCTAKRVGAEKTSSLEVLPGKGVLAQTAAGVITIGNADFLLARGIKPDEIPTAWEHDTVTCVALGEEFLGFITFFDNLKPGAFEAMEKLTKKGKKIYLLSGDNEKTVAWIAKESGIESYYAGVLPEEKAMHVRKAQAEKNIVAMAGDGFNDILALLRADVSIAFAKKDNLHTNWVDILIKNSDVNSLYSLLKMYKDFRVNVIENMVLAFIFNILLVVFIYYRQTATPWYTCIGFMMLGILAVAINSARLIRVK